MCVSRVWFIFIKKRLIRLIFLLFLEKLSLKSRVWRASVHFRCAISTAHNALSLAVSLCPT